MGPKIKVKELVIGLKEYPHMPYWGTLREAIVQLNVSYPLGHHTVLVFDEAYRLVGMLFQEDLVREMVSRLAQQHESDVPAAWEDLFKSRMEKQLGRPIKEFMSGVTEKIDAEDNIFRASHTMLKKGLYLAPVREGEKIIGIIRMEDIFHEMTHMIQVL